MSELRTCMLEKPLRHDPSFEKLDFPILSGKKSTCIRQFVSRSEWLYKKITEIPRTPVAN